MHNLNKKGFWSIIISAVLVTIIVGTLLVMFNLGTWNGIKAFLGVGIDEENITGHPTLGCQTAVCSMNALTLAINSVAKQQSISETQGVYDENAQPAVVKTLAGLKLLEEDAATLYGEWKLAEEAKKTGGSAETQLAGQYYVELIKTLTQIHAAKESLGIETEDDFEPVPIDQAAYQEGKQVVQQIDEFVDEDRLKTDPSYATGIADTLSFFDILDPSGQKMLELAESHAIRVEIPVIKPIKKDPKITSYEIKYNGQIEIDENANDIRFWEFGKTFDPKSQPSGEYWIYADYEYGSCNDDNEDWGWLKCDNTNIKALGNCNCVDEDDAKYYDTVSGIRTKVAPILEINPLYNVQLIVKYDHGKTCRISTRTDGRLTKGSSWYTGNDLKTWNNKKQANGKNGDNNNDGNPDEGCQDSPNWLMCPGIKISYCGKSGYKTDKDPKDYHNGIGTDLHSETGIKVKVDIDQKYPIKTSAVSIRGTDFIRDSTWQRAKDAATGVIRATPLIGTPLAGKTGSTVSQLSCDDGLTGKVKVEDGTYVELGETCVKCESGTCIVKNFEFPQVIESSMNPTKWIGGYGDPEYLAYYEAFPPAATEYWHVNGLSVFTVGVLFGGAALNMVGAGGGSKVIKEGVETAAKKGTKEAVETAAKSSMSKALKEAVESFFKKVATKGWKRALREQFIDATAKKFTGIGKALAREFAEKADDTLGKWGKFKRLFQSSAQQKAALKVAFEPLVKKIAYIPKRMAKSVANSLTEGIVSGHMTKTLKKKLYDLGLEDSIVGIITRELREKGIKEIPAELSERLSIELSKKTGAAADAIGDLARKRLGTTAPTATALESAKQQIRDEIKEEALKNAKTALTKIKKEALEKYRQETLEKLTTETLETYGRKLTKEATDEMLKKLTVRRFFTEFFVEGVASKSGKEFIFNQKAMKKTMEETLNVFTSLDGPTVRKAMSEGDRLVKEILDEDGILDVYKLIGEERVLRDGYKYAIEREMMEAMGGKEGQALAKAIEGSGFAATSSTAAQDAITQIATKKGWIRGTRDFLYKNRYPIMAAVAAYAWYREKQNEKLKSVGSNSLGLIQPWLLSEGVEANRSFNLAPEANPFYIMLQHQKDRRRDRLYFASPCKADLKVYTEKCTCNAIPGEQLYYFSHPDSTLQNPDYLARINTRNIELKQELLDNDAFIDNFLAERELPVIPIDPAIKDIADKQIRAKYNYPSSQVITTDDYVIFSRERVKENVKEFYDTIINGQGIGTPAAAIFMMYEPFFDSTNAMKQCGTRSIVSTVGSAAVKTYTQIPKNIGWGLKSLFTWDSKHLQNTQQLWDVEIDQKNNFWLQEPYPVDCMVVSIERHKDYNDGKNYCFDEFASVEKVERAVMVGSIVIDLVVSGFTGGAGAPAAMFVTGLGAGLIDIWVSTWAKWPGVNTQGKSSDFDVVECDSHVKSLFGGTCTSSIKVSDKDIEVLSKQQTDVANLPDELKEDDAIIVI